MRWRSETEAAANHLGWDVVETEGVDDYQGWGVHLLRKGNEWGVLSWSYGSCSGCDQYEDQCEGTYKYVDGKRTYTPVSDSRLAEIFGELIETCADEEKARQLFSDRKGW